MEYGSSLSVSGWQGFSSTPSHSSNEVIKWMNEAWKQTCRRGQCVPKMPLPTPQPFASPYFLRLRTVEEKAHRRLRQFLQCVCNIFISPGWHACSQHVIYACYSWAVEEEWGSLGSKDLWNLYLNPILPSLWWLSQFELNSCRRRMLALYCAPKKSIVHPT